MENQKKILTTTTAKKCSGKMEVYSRVVGYIRPIDDWNVAKQQEFDERITYKVRADAH